MSRYSETIHALNEAEKESEVDPNIATYETLRQIAISLAQIVDILKKEDRSNKK